LTGVRKITMPWARGALLCSLQGGLDEHLKDVIVRVDQPSPADWDGLGGSTWVGRQYIGSSRNRLVKLKGLVFPTENMTPSDADRLLSFIPWIKPMHSLKIRMPALTGPDGYEGRKYRKAFYRRMERMTELRELCLADGHGNWHQEEGQPGHFVPERYPTEAEFRRFSTLIAQKCPILVYLWILDRAWRITRPDGDDGKPKLRQLTAWEVKSDIPDAFDFGKPKVF
jgi:hypothetical protein